MFKLMLILHLLGAAIWMAVTWCWRSAFCRVRYDNVR